MSVSASPIRRHARLLVWAGLAFGVVFLVAAWAVPVYMGSLAPALLTRAGAGTPSVADLGEARLEDALPGASALLLAGARATAALSLDDLAADARASAEVARLENALRAFAQREPVLMPWGGDDPFLLPLVRQPAARAAAEQGVSVPVLRFFVTGEARAALRGFLVHSKLAAVRDTLALGTLENTGRFVPANRPGGQAYEALVLLAALLQQGEHLSTPFARLWREEARAAGARGELGALEPMLVDLLALGRRLDWRQLTAIAAAVETRETWAELGRLAREGGAPFDLVLAAVLVDGSAERVVRFRIQHPEPGEVDADLRFALAAGQGAVRLLLQRGVPLNRQGALAPGALVGFALLHPDWALVLRFVLCAAGAYLILRALDGMLGGGESHDSVFHLRSGALALVATGVFIVVTEPYLGRGAPPRIEGLTLAMPVLGNLADPSSLRDVAPSFAMDTHSLLAIALFCALQIAMYVICLAKIRAIDAFALAPLVKLRLMENEENLFDGGLYLGIGGTAAALVMQVLGLVEPNLLAAYSSNLLGITCVALVKIRHVRPYKTKLILAAQDAISAGDPTAARAAATR